MLGWYILVRKRTLGGAIGYSSGRNNSSLKMPSTRVLGRTANADAKNVKQTTYSGTDCHLGPGWSHRNTSGCPHVGQQRFQARGPPQDALFPVVWRRRGRPEHQGGVARVTHLDYPLRSWQCYYNMDIGGAGRDAPSEETQSPWRKSKQ